MTKIVHPVAGALAMLTIAVFWLSTAVFELAGTPEMIVAVKTAIPWGFLLLIPAMAAIGGSGFSLSRGRWAGLVGTKLRRMRIIAANGLIVLIPAALFLAAEAKAGHFGAGFYSAQAIELVAGALNLALLALNMRDGFRLSGRMRRGRSTQ